MKANTKIPKLNASKIAQAMQLALFLSFLNICSGQNTSTSNTLVLGVGIGTFIIIIAIAFSIVWCLVCRASSRPELYGSIGVIVPIVLIIAFIFTPKQSSRSSTTNLISDGNFIPHVIFVLLALIGLIVGLVMIFLNYFMSNKKAKSIARSAFVLREDQQQQERLSASGHGMSGQGSNLELGQRGRNQRQQLIQ